jgi:renalase
MAETVVVVGAGISGLLVARDLRARGVPVVVVEKSRGFGGRLATKRVGTAVFDQGAQYFTARSPRFAAAVAEWRDRGVVAPWPGSTHRFVARPSMNALGKMLAEGVEVRREWHVRSARRANDGWVLAADGRPPLRAGRLVVTAPVPQSLALFDDGTLPPKLVEELRSLQYAPCLALLVTLRGPSAVPAEGVAPGGEPVRWIADNTKKGVAPGVPAAVTVHLGPAFSAEHYEKTAAELATLVLPAVRRWLGADVADVEVHRWRFSEPTTTLRAPSVWLPDLGVGFAGDAFGGPRVEGAAVSGLDVADRITGPSAARDATDPAG